MKLTAEDRKQMKKDFSVEIDAHAKMKKEANARLKALGITRTSLAIASKIVNSNFLK